MNKNTLILIDKLQKHIKNKKYMILVEWHFNKDKDTTVTLPIWAKKTQYLSLDAPGPNSTQLQVKVAQSNLYLEILEYLLQGIQQFKLQRTKNIKYNENSRPTSSQHVA